jgi:hypothetical protein
MVSRRKRGKKTVRKSVRKGSGKPFKKGEDPRRNKKTQFKKGCKAGPGRPPKGETIKDLIDKELNEYIERKTRQGLWRGSRRAWIVEQQIRRAEKGNQRAIEYLMDRIEGRPVQGVLNLPMEPIKIEFIPLTKEDYEKQDNVEVFIPTKHDSPSEPT